MDSFVRLISSIIVWIVLAFLLVLFVAFYGVELVGYKPYTVLSDSMAPAIPKGSMAYVQKVDPSTLKAGDVITFERGEVGEQETYYDIFGDVITLDTGTKYIFTHRIVSADRENRCFIVKGDANDKEDPSAVGYGEVKGKVAYGIPIVGYINVWMHTDMGRIVIVVGVVVFLLLVFLSSCRPKPNDPDKGSTSGDDRGLPVSMTAPPPSSTSAQEMSQLWASQQQFTPSSPPMTDLSEITGSPRSGVVR